MLSLFDDFLSGELPRKAFFAVDEVFLLLTTSILPVLLKFDFVGEKLFGR